MRILENQDSCWSLHLHLYFECEPYILSPDLGHDVPFPAKVFVAQGEEVVDNKGLVAVSDSIEVDIVVIGREK